MSSVIVSGGSSLFVDLSTNQTISGVKTFSGDVVLNNDKVYYVNVAANLPSNNMKVYYFKPYPGDYNITLSTPTYAFINTVPYWSGAWSVRSNGLTSSSNPFGQANSNSTLNNVLFSTYNVRNNTTPYLLLPSKVVEGDIS